MEIVRTAATGAIALIAPLYFQKTPIALTNVGRLGKNILKTNINLHFNSSKVSPIITSIKTTAYNSKVCF